MIREYFFLTSLLLLPFLSLSQKAKVMNLQSFDQKPYHFGFTLGINSSNFYMENKADFSFDDSLLVLEAKKQSGFNLGMIGSLNINKNVSLRFIPALSFQERLLEYTFYESDTLTLQPLVEKRVESTFIDLPINLKLRTNRINNFAAYLVTGVKYGIDMASQRNVENSSDEDDIVVKIQQNDLSGEIGVGTDFFLPYFKFGIEMKLSAGFRDIFVPDDTKFSNPIESLRSKFVLISFTFEG